MSTYIPDLELEKKEILRKYKLLISGLYDKTTKEQRKIIRKAFILSVDAHQNMRRKSGEPYIYHPLAVATIVAQEIGLGTTSVVCALLHDVVEDTEIELSEIKDIFGETIANIIDGLTKIEDIEFDLNTSIQAENFRKILVSMGIDIRVILIKLADRLHNMRTLEFMSEEKRLKISSETSFFYVPIAHRLGFYKIKSELEDYAMKYTDTIAYNMISEKIKSTETEREVLIQEFVAPINQRLLQEGIKAEMSSRVKSIFSIQEKMKKKKVGFEEVYDVFAVRYVFDAEPKDENRICYAIADIVKKLYRNNPNRVRDFLTTPKPNGYQSLHVTVMSNSGKWIEVQIRSKRMDEIAENGFAAHFKYKEEQRTPDEYKNRVEDWLTKIKEILKSDDINALEFLNEIKLNLNVREITVFTPQGDMITLPVKATVLDFAYELHTKLGNQCIGAKVNYNIVPIDYILKTGDQIEIITSKKQKPSIDWFDMVITSRAKSCIKEAVRMEQKKQSEVGVAKLKELLEEMNLEPSQAIYKKLQSALKMKSQVDFWSFAAEGKLTKGRVKRILTNEKNSDLEEFQEKLRGIEDSNTESIESLINQELTANPEIFMIDDTFDKIQHMVAPCCKPIPGDQVVGFQMTDDVIFIHRTNCENAKEQMSKFGNRIIKAKWRKEQKIAFLSGIRIYGFDKKGLLKDIINVVTSQMDLNIRALNIETQGNVFTGSIMLYIQSVKALTELIEKLQAVDNIDSVERIGFDSE